AASTKPFGFMPFYPGPGLGGHCIPIDPFYLTWKAREFEFQTKFIELAGDINIHMPRYVVQRTMHALNLQKKALNGARVMVLLKAEGAEVSYHDPFVPFVKPGHEHNLDMKSVPLTKEALASADVVL